MKKGILVVSFGTSYKETRMKCIDSVEKDIQNEYPDYQVRRAFTSSRIVKKLKERDGIHIDSTEEALNKMIEEGIQSIVVQPLHIIPGFEYDKIRKNIILLNHNIDVHIKLGLPLLYKDEYYDEVVENILRDIPEESNGNGFIFMGHGTKHFANACYSMLQNKISEIRKDVFIANVEGYPELKNIEGKIVDSFSKITLIPFMLVAGDHAMNDMIGDKSFKSYLEEKGIDIEYQMKGLGENPRIRSIFVKRIEEIIE